MDIRALVVASAVVAASAGAGAQTKTNFSGDWVLNRAASTLQGPTAAVERGTLRITHTEPTFTFDRTFVVGGMEYKGAFTQTTDGREVEKPGPQPGSRGRSRLTWDGASLVLNALIATPNGEVHNDVRYELLEGGRVLRATEDVTGPMQHHNVWIYEKP